jgi:Cu/Ag efflux pump CusA
MALVILGGIVTSTALNMVVIPALYLKFGGAEARRRHGEPAIRTAAVSD